MAKGDESKSPRSPKSPKDKEKAKGPVNVKGTPSPPRHKAGEEPAALPPYSITWTASAVCVETAGPAVDLQRLVEDANLSARPALSFAIVDAQEMLSEELADEESVLGRSLLAAREESVSSPRKDKEAKEGKGKEKEKVKDKGIAKGKDKGQGQVGSWLKPSHLQELLAARQLRDRDFEHRQEAVRRALELEEAKRKAEEAKKDVESMQAQLAASRRTLQDFEDRDRKRIREEWWVQKATAAAAEAAAKAPPAKGDKKGEKSGNKQGQGASAGKKPPTPPKGKEKGKEKGKGAPAPVLTPQEERIVCQDGVKQSEAALEAAEATVVAADNHVLDLEARMNEPFTTDRVYCCLGFGDSALSISELAASQDNLFCAILNVAKKPPPPPPPLPLDSSPAPAAEQAGKKGGAKAGAKAMEKEKPKKDEIPSRPSSPAEKGKKASKGKVAEWTDPPVPALVAEMRALAESSHLTHPARKIYLMDVFWEEKMEEEAPQDEKADKTKSGVKKEKEAKGEKRPSSPPGSKKGKGGKDEGGLPYTQIAEAMVTSCKSLAKQVSEFRRMDSNSRYVEIPIAIPIEEVRMDHYRHLLDEVAPELVSVPIILHCLMEQVAVVDCEKKDLEALEAVNQRKEARVLLEQAFLNLGKRAELPYHSPFGNVYLPPEFDYDEMEDPPACEPGCTCELHPYTFDGRAVEARKRSRYEEHLNVVHEISWVGQLKAILTRRRQDPHKIKHEPQLSLSAATVVDPLRVVQRMVKLLPTPGAGRRDFPCPPSFPLEKRGTCMTALRKFSRIFFPAAQRYRKLRHIADLLLNRKVETVPTKANLSEEESKGFASGVVENVNKEESKVNSLMGDCSSTSEGGKVSSGSEEEWHVRPSRFTQTSPLTVLREEAPPIEPAFDQSKLRPHESILNCRFVDAFPDDTFGEVYSKARLALPFERKLYDKDEDFMISVLYAEEGEHKWSGRIPSLIPFGRFCGDPTASQKRIADFEASHKTCVPPTVYGIDDADNSIIESKNVFLAEEESLVCNGLPVQSKAESATCHKPQATLYKDGATYLLRGQLVSDKECASLENSLTACLKDGVILCFYITNDGSTSLQVTHPTGRTFELTSSGVVLIFPTNVKEREKERAAEKAAQEASEKALLEQEQAALLAEAAQNKGGKKGAKAEGKGKDEPTAKGDGKGKTGNVKGDAKGKGDGKGKKGDKKGDKVEEPEDDKPSDSSLPLDDQTNNIKSISDILKKERGEEEVWRCVLPSGTVVRYRENGESQLLFSNGNVSESQLHAAAAAQDPAPTLEEVEAQGKVKKDGKGKDKAKGSEKGAKDGKAEKKKEKNEKDAKEDKGGKAARAEPASPLPAASSGVPEEGDLPVVPAVPECPWIVTNNKGFTVLQTPFKPLPPPEEPEPDPKATKDGKGKSKGKDGERVSKDPTTGPKDSKKGEEGKKGSDTAKGKGGDKGTQGKGSGKDAKVSPDVLMPEEAAAVVMEPPVTVPAEEPKPTLVQLPKKKVVQVTDPDTESFITVREDLVILMQPPDESYCFVQHADGTQIHTELKEVTLEKEKPKEAPVPKSEPPEMYCPLHNPRRSLIKKRESKHDNAIMDAWRQSIRPSSLPGPLGLLGTLPHPPPLTQVGGETGSPVSQHTPANLPSPGYASSDGANGMGSPQEPKSPHSVAQPEGDRKYPFSRRKLPSKTISEPPLMEVDTDAGRTCPHCLTRWKEVHRPPPIVVEPPPTTTVWHMRKDGFPNIQGKLGEGVAVQFETFEGRYHAAWSQPSQQLSFLLPNGVILYTAGKTVFLDNSRGVDQGHPDVLLVRKKDRDQAINTNGLYAFDLEEGSLYHTDKDGNGYITHKGFIVDLLQNGLPVRPPSPPKPPYVPIDYSAIKETPEVAVDDTDSQLTGAADPKAKGKGQGKGGPSRESRSAEATKAVTTSEPSQKQHPSSSSSIPSSGKKLDPAPVPITVSAPGPVAEPKGLFTPKLHIPVPPIPPAELPVVRDSQWGVKGLPPPGQPPAQPCADGSQLSGIAIPVPLLSSVSRISSAGAVLQPKAVVADQSEGDPQVLTAEGEAESGVAFELASNSDASLLGPPRPENPKLLSNELGPPPRIFVAHDGGYGFEICCEKTFAKYVLSKQRDKFCHIATEGFYGGEESTTFHTFITVKDLWKEPYAPFVPRQENPLPPSVPINPLAKLEPLTEKTMGQAKLAQVRKVTKCPWVDLEFEFPVLPRIVAPCKPPSLPCCKETLVSYRRICEYPEFIPEQLEKVERALGEYEKWKCEVLEKPLVEVVDPRTEEEIAMEKEISECIRQGLTEQKNFEAKELGVMDNRYAAELLRRMRNGEAWRIEQLLREERALQAKRKAEFQKYMEKKCHPTLCIHKPDLLQKTGPYRPVRNAILRYWKCEEGLRALLDMLGESVTTLSDVEEEDPDQITMEEIEILIKATKQEATDIFEEMTRLMEEFRGMELFPKEVEFKPKEPEEPPCCFIEWMILLEKYHRKNYPRLYEEEAAELERLRREEYLRKAKIECDKLLEDMISETETEHAKLAAYRSPSFHSSEYLRDEFWDELMRSIADPTLPPASEEVDIMSPPSSVTEEDQRSVFRRKWDTSPWHLNAAYLSVEEAFRVISYFNSVYLLRQRNLPRDRPQQFHLMPGHMNFRKVKFMSTSLQVAYLLNFHDDMGRFKIRKLEECLKVLYEHGPVAPGMLRKIRVFFKALRVGDYADEVEIITEFDVFKIPVTATVLAPEEELPDEIAPQQVPNSATATTTILPLKPHPQPLQVVVPSGPPPTDNIPPPEETCGVVKDLLSWLQSETMGEVLIKGHR